MLPVAPPTLGDCGIALAPGPCLEVIESLLAGLGIFGPVDRLQGGYSGLSVLP
jgi:hypothetical protein